MKRVMPYIHPDYVESISDYLTGYDFWHDGILDEFEARIAKMYGRKFGLTVNSASNAIFMCLCVRKRKSNKNKVILPNYGYPAAFKACKFLELEVVPVDIETNTLSMNIDHVVNVIDSDILAVIHIENNGVVGNIKSIKDRVPSDILFIEDSAPSMLQDKAGVFGDVSIFSFGPTKPVLTGEGSIILTDDPDIYNDLKLLRHTPNYDNKEPSLNFLMSPILVSYAMPQLDFLREIREMRTWVQTEYEKHINIFSEPDATRNYGAVMYLSPNAEKISKSLSVFGIDHRYKYYPLYEEMGFPVSREVRDSIIDLPMHQELSEDNIETICYIVKRAENE